MTAANDDINATITCAGNGPYIVSGLAHLTGADGAAIETEQRMALCRCGASKNKPLWDGSHWQAGFKDPA